MHSLTPPEVTADGAILPTAAASLARNPCCDFLLQFLVSVTDLRCVVPGHWYNPTPNTDPDYR